ncbi:MAG: hypothetical protein HOJ13_06435 [Nitrospina sp.]|nr:hypothetical protein [Nitrospina sp.]
MNTLPEDKNSKKNYEAVLSIKDGKYFFYVNELQLIASGETLDSAYHQLNLMKDERIREFEEAGFLEKLPPPTQNSATLSVSIKRKETGIFIIKSLVAGFMFIMVIIFTGNTLKSILSSYPQKIKTTLKELPRQFLREMEYELHNAAELELSAARQEKIKASIKVVGENIKPYLNELGLSLLKSEKGKEASGQQ